MNTEFINGEDVKRGDKVRLFNTDTKSYDEVKVEAVAINESGVHLMTDQGKRTVLAKQRIGMVK